MASPRQLPRILLSAAIALLVSTSAADAGNWPAWRGPDGNGITKETDLPTEWSATKNVRWKMPLPERGNSTPIAWGDKVFLAQAEGDQRMLYCVNRKDGALLWKKGVTAKPGEPTHDTNPYCSAAPVTDGERVIAWFGSDGLVCYDLEGKELWKAELPAVDHEWGYGSSPVLHGDLCFLYFGPGTNTATMAFNKKTGEKVWEVKMPPVHPEKRTDNFAGKKGVVGSWSTPIIVEENGRATLVNAVPERVLAMDPATGKELWSCAGLNPLVYSSVMYGEGIVVGSGGFGGSSLAVKTGGSGDVTESHRLWHKLRDKQRIGSGVIKDGHLYILNTPGTAQCIELATGKPVWEERLTGPSGRSESWSSMILSGDRIYVLNQGSDTAIIKASPTFEKLGSNSLEDGLTNSSIAVSDGELFIRTHKHLWCIGKSAE
ncbi:MAG: PQQ-binding-like beta-propeller repeat protein [Chthoniobacteraceae bacterium]